MNTLGFVISHKNGEGRRALLPKDIADNIINKEQLFFEKGYGQSVGISDGEYEKVGVHIVDRKDVLKCDIIVDVKLGDADYLDEIENGKTLFGWAHAVQNISFTDKALSHGYTVIAWEEMFEDGRYVFYRNREVAGEAAVIQAFRYSGKMPYDSKVAILGNGQTAKGALRVLHGLDAKVDVYDRKFENLFKKRMFDYDVLINCIMWDTNRTDHIIYNDDLKKMKPGTLIIDVSCDPHLGIESSHPTTISDPVYVQDGVIHYAVDNTPAMYPKTVTNVLSEGLSKYIDIMVEGTFNETINNATVIDNGSIKMKEIIEFRKARNLFCK